MSVVDLNDRLSLDERVERALRRWGLVLNKHAAAHGARRAPDLLTPDFLTPKVVPARRPNVGKTASFPKTIVGEPHRRG